MKTKSLVAASFALLLLAACGSSGIGDVLGGGNNNNQTYQIRGVVDSVDTNSQSVYLTNVSGYSTMLSNGGSGSTARVYFDNSTQVDYQGRAYRPQDLERGDEVTVNVDESNNQLLAQSMTVTYDASNNNSSSNYPNSNQQSTIRGTVYSIDSSRHTMTLESTNWISGFQGNTNSGSRVTVYYDNNASVDVQGRLYPISNLERGDVVDVRVYGSNSSSLQAQSIVLVRDINSR